MTALVQKRNRERNLIYLFSIIIYSHYEKPGPFLSCNFSRNELCAASVVKRGQQTQQKNKQTEPKQQRQQNIVLECLKLLYPHIKFFIISSGK